jgi:hypothetical protein
MNRYLTISLSISVTLGTLAIPLRAANKPRGGEMKKTAAVWTNEDLEGLRAPGLISVVGPPATVEDASPAATPSLYVAIHDSEWYAEEATALRGELERRQARLDEYRQMIEDARSLKTTTGGINLEEGDIGITPEAGIEILQRRVTEVQEKLGDLEDLARRNDIEPGTLHGQ